MGRGTAPGLGCRCAWWPRLPSLYQHLGIHLREGGELDADAPSTPSPPPRLRPTCTHSPHPAARPGHRTNGQRTSEGRAQGLTPQPPAPRAMPALGAAEQQPAARPPAAQAGAGWPGLPRHGASTSHTWQEAAVPAGEGSRELPRGDGVTPGKSGRRSRGSPAARHGPGTARHGPGAPPGAARALLRVMFSFPPICGAFPASKCQAHKERHCERKTERGCLPASLRKCRLTLHQGSLCKRGTRLTTGGLCWPATAAARRSIPFSFPLSCCFHGLGYSLSRRPRAQGAPHCAARWGGRGDAGGPAPALPSRCSSSSRGQIWGKRRVGGSAGVGHRHCCSSSPSGTTLRSAWRGATVRTTGTQPVSWVLAWQGGA